MSVSVRLDEVKVFLRVRGRENHMGKFKVKDVKRRKQRYV